MGWLDYLRSLYGKLFPSPEPDFDQVLHEEELDEDDEDEEEDEDEFVI